MKLSVRESWWVLLLSALAAWPACAVTVPDLYEAAVPVTSGRDAAFVEALKSVVVRVSGRRDAAVRLGAALNDPRQYVQRFGMTADNVLQVGFDSVSVDKLLGQAGLPVWGRERPATLVLLQVTAANGSSYWVDGSTNPAEREVLAKAAQLRGLPLVWPQLSPQDRDQLAVGEGSPAALLQIAARYNANATLLGKARNEGGGMAVRWTLASKDGAAEDSGSLEDGVHLAADTFARIFATSGSTLDSVTVEIAGIDDLNAYANVLNYLEGMTLVRSVAVEQVQGATLRYKLDVRGDAGTLQRALALDGRLVPVQPGEGAAPADRLQFRYHP